MPGDIVPGDSPVGRARELDVLRRALRATADGAGGCLVLRGPAGIGKSRLLRAAVDAARAMGMSVASRRAFELDRAVTLLTLGSTLRACEPPTDAFAWLADDAGHSFGTVERLGAALEAQAARAPLLVVVDDTHWADEFSAAALRQLVPALAASPVRWLFAARPEPADTPGQRLLDGLVREGAEQLDLERLSDEAVGDLCAQVLGADVDASVLALARGFGGIPLQLTQLMSSLRVTDQLVVADGVASVVGTALPSSFVAMIRQVLDQLPEETRRLVRAASVFDRPFAVGEAARLLGRRPAELLPLVEQATDATILVEEGHALTFVHDLVRRAVHSTLGTSIAAVLHAEAAEIARADGRPPMEIATHLVSSGAGGRQDTVDLLRTAARDVADGAPSTAADFVLHALEAVGDRNAERYPLIAEAVGYLAAAGRLTEAQTLGRTVLRAGLDRRTEALLLLGLAEAFKHAGKNATAVDYADQGLDVAGPADALAANLYAIRAHALVYTGDLAEADRSGEQADTIGSATNEWAAAVFGRAARSLVAQTTGDLDAALRHAASATDTADRAGGQALQRHPRIWLAGAYTALDRFTDAARTLERGRAESERLGTGWSAPLWHYYTAALLAARGNLDEALAEADAGVAVAEQLGSHQLAVPLLATLVRLAVDRGEIPAAEGYLRRMHHLMRTGITAAPEDVVWAEGLLLDATAGASAAMPALAPLYDVLPDRPILVGQDPGSAATLVRIALAAGDTDRARIVVRVAGNLAERNPGLAALAGACAHADGLLSGDLRALRTAIGRFRRTPRRLALAAALDDAATLADDPTAARGWRREALTIRAACGAKRADPEPVERDNPVDRLTPAERRVALLVADGLTNHQVAAQLHLSRHTVDSHLRKIFFKWDIQTRVALAAIVAKGSPE